MSNLIIHSNEELKKTKELLEKKIPSYRQAYSDRTSWLMACMSELSYARFNPMINNKMLKLMMQRVSNVLKKNDQKALTGLIESFAYDEKEELKNLNESLKSVEFKLDKTFDKNGTQAILVTNSKLKLLVLAFRGTEKNSIKDIKTDADAKIINDGNDGKIHQGFSEAYNEVALEIQQTLDQELYSKMPLFITGHSLGGALATIAAKKLSHKAGLAACYTFGSPRVGNAQWISGIKTPLYRVVNAADCVTMLPPGNEIITLISWLLTFIPNVGKKMRDWLQTKIGGYLHGGDMRYLTNCPSGNYNEVRLLYAVSFWFRIKGFIIKKLPWKHFLADHSISIYRQKLAILAFERSKPNV